MNEELMRKNGLDKEDFEPSELNAKDMAEEALLQAKYNEILIEILMEG